MRLEAIGLLTLIGSTLSVTGCAGVGGEETTTQPDNAKVAVANAPLKAPPPAVICPGRCIWTSGSITGVGTSDCEGSESSSWGNSTQGGRIVVTCDSWYFEEWGPGFHVIDSGNSVNGSASYDWAT